MSQDGNESTDSSEPPTVQMWVVVKQNWHGESGFAPFRASVTLFSNDVVNGGALFADVFSAMQDIWHRKKKIENHGLENFFCEYACGKQEYRQFRLLKLTGEVLVDDRDFGMGPGTNDLQDPIESGSRASPLAVIDFYDVSWRKYFDRMRMASVDCNQMERLSSPEQDLTLMWGKIEPKPSKAERWRDFCGNARKFAMNGDERAIEAMEDDRSNLDPSLARSNFDRFVLAEA